MDKKFIIEASSKRCAVKVFDKERIISDMDFTFLLEMARLSPSSFGLEPWKIIVIQNEKIRQKLSEVASGGQRQLKTASHFVVFTITKDLLPTSKYFNHINRDIKHFSEDDCRNFLISYSAFCDQKLNLYDDRTRYDWAKKQAYIALSNMILSAALIGIDSCPIEGFLEKEAEQVLADAGIMDLSNEKIAVMAAFGYRDTTVSIHPKNRRELREIVKYVD